jgi:hypothetical protein
MDKIVDACFERVEKALATLVESITKYNPQASHAVELATADGELSQGLKKCIDTLHFSLLGRPGSQASQSLM